MVIRGIGENNGVTEHSRCVVCGGGRWSHSGEAGPLARGLSFGKWFMDRIRFRDILEGCS